MDNLNSKVIEFLKVSDLSLPVNYSQILSNKNNNSYHFGLNQLFEFFFPKDFALVRSKIICQ